MRPGCDGDHGGDGAVGRDLACISNDEDTQNRRVAGGCPRSHAHPEVRCIREVQAYSRCTGPGSCAARFGRIRDHNIHAQLLHRRCRSHAYPRGLLWRAHPTHRRCSRVRTVKFPRDRGQRVATLRGEVLRCQDPGFDRGDVFRRRGSSVDGYGCTRPRPPLPAGTQLRGCAPVCRGTARLPVPAGTGPWSCTQTGRQPPWNALREPPWAAPAGPSNRGTCPRELDAHRYFPGPLPGPARGPGPRARGRPPHRILRARARGMRCPDPGPDRSRPITARTLSFRSPVCTH